MGEREARAQQGKRAVRRLGPRGYRKTAAWGKTWRGPEASGVGKSEATIHPSLRSPSQLLVSTYIKLGHAAGICAVAGNLIAFGRQWNTLESACRCQHFVLPQHLGETEAAGMWLKVYQLTRGTGILGQQGSPFLQQLGEAGPGFPRKGSVITCMYLDIYMGR